MPGSFEPVLFRDVRIDDDFFASLKEDYDPVEFAKWCAKKSAEDAEALVYRDAQGIGAFVYLKDEDEPIPLLGETLPAEPRVKIGTLKVAEHNQGERLGEGAIGLALWHWRETGRNQVYVTVFPKHESLIAMLRKFGFRLAGSKENGESVYLKDRRAPDFSTAYRCFPLLDPTFECANLLPIEDRYHDILFPYSELANTQQLEASFRSDAANGVTKMYFSKAASLATAPRHPILVYRIHTGQGQKAFKSVVTSYCIVTDVTRVKGHGQALEPFEEYRSRVRNKSVFGDEEIANWYRGANLTTVEMVYLGYFGAGNNVNYRWLVDNGYWRDMHPHQFVYSPAELAAILKEGGVDLATLVANQS